MALNELQQLAAILKGSKYILFLFNDQNNGDAIAAALALKLFLEKQHKQVDIAASEFSAPKNLSFLPGAKTIKPALTQLQKFIIKVDVTRNPIDTISYDIKENTLSIYLTPKSGLISKQELRTAQSTFKYDLIVTFGTADLESLGSVYFNNTDLFYRTTIVNIDHQSNNERYGQINIVDLRAAATAEIVYKIIKQLDEKEIDADIATALYAGMTVATKSFRAANMTPGALQSASELVTYGADREKVIQALYRTRSIGTLQLWGHVWANLEHGSAGGLVWSSVTQSDFARSGAKPEDLKGVVEELISNAPEAKVIALFYEKDGTAKNIECLLTTEKKYDALELLKPFHPIGNKRQATSIISGKPLPEVQEEIIKIIRQTITSK